MPKLSEWLGSIIFLIALIEFIPNPRKAIQSIPEVLATNVRIVDGRLGLVRPKAVGRYKNQKRQDTSAPKEESDSVVK